MYNSGNHSYRSQLAVALALMTVIPLLTMAYFLRTYITPNVVTRENVIVVLSLNIVLAFSGFTLLAMEVEKRTKALRTLNTELADSEAKFRAMFDNASDGILVADVEDTGFLAANEAMCEMLGYTHDELLRMSVKDIHPEESLPHVREVFQEQVSTGRKLAPDIPMKRKDGSGFSADVNAATLEMGERRCLMGVFRDTTQRKDMEQQLADANVRLQAALSDLKTREKQIVQHERLSALGRMASGIAHDFNNVLMPIVGLSEFTREHPEILDDRKESARILRQIEEAGRDAKHIVQRLRMIHKPRDRREFVPMDLNKLIESAIELTRPRWREEMDAGGVHITITRNFGELPPVSVNATEIREVLINLIMNSVDAMPEGGPLTVSSRLDNGRATIEVRDEGSGMDEASLRSCLEPFFTTKGVGGTGLGLALAHGIMERHNGSMEIESELGRGTTVRLHLPVSQRATVRQRKEETAPPPKPVRPLKVLVIDDEKRSRRLLGRFLRSDNHAVAIASTGEEAREMLSQGSYELVITDRAMPDISGDEVAKAAKAANPSAPVILLTGFGELMKDKGEKPECVDLVMSKPVTQSDLRRVVSEVIT